MLTKTVEVIDQRSLDASSIIRLGLDDRLIHAFIAAVALDRLTAWTIPGSRPEPNAVVEVSDLTRQWTVCADQDPADAASPRRPRVTIDLNDEPLPTSARSQRYTAEAGSWDEATATVTQDIAIPVAPAALAHLLGWIQLAPTRKVLAWAADETLELGSALPQQPAKEIKAAYRWLIDRLTVTYLKRWHTDSLHYEWRWIHNQIEAPFDVSVLAERAVDLESLNAEIAQRAVNRQADAALLTHAETKNRALDLLRAGDRRSASALFRAVCRERPDDAEAHNNVGFCLLPDEPTQALIHLLKSRELGFDSFATNAVNMMQAYFLNYHYRLALDVAQAVWETWKTSAPRLRAHLWSWENPEAPQPVLIDDQRIPVLYLAAEAAKRLGNERAEGLWRNRHSEHCPSHLPDRCECAALVPRYSN
ncbi:hypothetical protein ACWDSF_06850 [Nocardia beijingensis]